MDPLLWLKYKKVKGSATYNFNIIHSMLTTIPSFFIKMLFLVDDFMVKIHIILKLYVALPFTFLYLKHDRGSK